MSIHRGCLPWQKLTQKITILTRACRHTVAGLLFVFVDHGAGIRRATYLCLDCAKNVDKNWNITVSFIIHVNLDHAWAEHYPVTLSSIFRKSSIRRVSQIRSHIYFYIVRSEAAYRIFLTTVNHKYFVLKICLDSRKLNTRKYMHNVNDNVV